MIHDYLIAFLTYTSIYVIVVTSLNIAVGFTGLINLGHMVFFGIGAYTSALLALHGLPWYAAIILACIISSIMGICLAAMTVRLKGDYLAMVSLGMVFIAIAVSRNWTSLTRGALGLPGVPAILSNNFYYMLLVLAITAASVLFFYWLTNSETGKIFQAIRDDETAAQILGKNTYFYKALSIGISTFIAGLAGALFVHYIRFVDPTIFDLEFFVFLLSMLIAGGLASIKGSVIGVVILQILSEGLKFVVLKPELVGVFRQMLFMAILILILIYRPRGIFGKVDV